MEIILKNIGLKRVSVISDGNCQFRALSMFFKNHPFSDYRYLRSSIVSFILNNQNKFKSDISSLGYHNVESYAFFQSQDRVWGDGITLQAFGLLTKINIWLIVPTGLLRITEFGKSRPNIALIYQNQHYEAATPII